MVKIRLQYFEFPDLTHPRGYLPRDKRAQACWYYYTLAQKLYEFLGSGTEDQFGLLETELWLDPQYAQIARSVSLLYQLESPDEFMKFWDYVERQADSMGYPKPAQIYKRPLAVVIQ